MEFELKRDGRRLLRRAVEEVRRFAYAPRRVTRASQPRLGLALGGGFARGMAHIGVLKVLAEQGIPIDALAGVSAGAIAAAAYASGCSLDDMLEQARAIRWNRIGRWTLPRLGFASNERLETLLGEMLCATTFEELRIPLAVVAADLLTGEAVVFREGDLAPALRASSTVPGLFAPVEYGGRRLVDGSIVTPMPVDALHTLGVDRVVAVDLASHPLRREPSNFFQIVGQAFQIAGRGAARVWRPKCDLVIEPDVSEFRWDDFERLDQLVEAGERATRAALPALRSLLEPRVRAKQNADAGRLAEEWGKP